MRSECDTTPVVAPADIMLDRDLRTVKNLPRNASNRTCSIANETANVFNTAHHEMACQRVNDECVKLNNVMTKPQTNLSARNKRVTGCWSTKFACLWIFLCLFNKVTVGIPVMPSSEGKEDHDWWNNPCGGNKIGVEKPSTNRSEILGAIDTALSQYLLINSTFIPAANFSRLWTQTPQFVNDDIINETKNMALPDNAKTLSKSFNEDITADLILNLKGNITEVLKEPLCNAYNHMLLNAYRIEFLNMTNENELNKITPFTNPDLEDLRNHFYDIKRLYANLMCYFHSCLTKLGYKTEPLSEEDKQNVRETKSENSYFGWLVYREVINCVENVENILSAVKENINNSSLYFS